MDGLCGYLHTATLCTNDIYKINQFYVEGMGMTLVGPMNLSDQQRAFQQKMWDLSPEISYDYYHLHRSNVPSLIQVRVLVMHADQPSVHRTYDSLELGPFSLGFPNMDQECLDNKLEALGIQAMAPMQIGTIPRPDGTEYRYYETIYKGPNYLHCVGIQRGDGMPQLAPCDEETKLGGPGYSAQVIEHSDHFISFMTDVLDMELRGDRYWESAEGSALGVAEGTPFRFMLVYAKGTQQNHFLFLDFQKSEMIDTGVPPRIPNLGLSAWTIPTRNINEVYHRALAFGAHIVTSPDDYTSPIFGKCKIFSMHAPNGFMIELFEKVQL